MIKAASKNPKSLVHEQITINIITDIT